jgi:hypothetical protein
MTLGDFEEYVKTVGLHKIRRKNLDKLIESKGRNVFLMKDFKDVYEIAILNDNTRLTNIWGVIIVLAVIAVGIYIKMA